MGFLATSQALHFSEFTHEILKLLKFDLTFGKTHTV